MDLNNDDLTMIYENGLKYLHGLSFYRDVQKSSVSRFSIEISLTNGEGEFVSITAIDAFDIKIGSIDNMFGLMFGAQDIRDRQIEGASLMVSDAENDVISFLCKKIIKTPLRF